jgi:hypothetical protein
MTGAPRGAPTAPIRSDGADSAATPDYREASSGDAAILPPSTPTPPPPFPPVQGKPPAHYLKGAKESWRSWVNAEQSGMGPVGAGRENLSHGGYRDGHG